MYGCMLHTSTLVMLGCVTPSTLSSCSRQALLQLKETPRGLWSNDPALRPCESTDASGLDLSLSKPVTATWCPCWLLMMPSRFGTPAHRLVTKDALFLLSVPVE